MQWLTIVFQKVTATLMSFFVNKVYFESSWVLSLWCTDLDRITQDHILLTGQELLSVSKDLLFWIGQSTRLISILLNILGINWGGEVVDESSKNSVQLDCVLIEEWNNIPTAWDVAALRPWTQEKIAPDMNSTTGRQTITYGTNQSRHTTMTPVTNLQNSPFSQKKLITMAIPFFKTTVSYCMVLK